MRLLFIITDYGAFNNFLIELASKIAENDSYELHIICSNIKVIDIKDKQIHNKSKIKFHYVDIPRKISILGHLNAAKKINKIIKIIQPDLIHAHFTTASFPTLLFKISKYTYWSTFHGLGMNSTNGLRKLVFTFVEIFCFIKLDKIFVLNTVDYNLIRRIFGNKVRKYESLGIGCDIEKFNPLKFKKNNKDELRTFLNIKKEVNVISFTGRFVNFKGFNIVIKAFKNLEERYPGKFALILMGGLDPIHMTGLSTKEHLFFKNNRNIYNIGFTNEVEKFLSISDIFLFPSKKEGLPTCILEALAMGVPVVTFNSRGNNDIIKNNYNGILIDANLNTETELKAITDVIIKLSTNLIRPELIVANAISERHLYSRNNFIREHLVFYDHFLKKILNKESKYFRKENKNHPEKKEN